MPKPEKEKDGKKKFRILLSVEKSLNGTHEIVEEVELGEFPTEEKACEVLEDLLEAAGFEEIDDDEKQD